MRRFLCIILAVSSLLALVSCSVAPPISCVEIVEAMLSKQDSTDGRLYFIGASSPDQVLTKSLMTALFDESVLGYFYLDAEGKSAVDDCAVFLSPTGICELFVFRAADSHNTPSLARLCLSRLDSLNQQISTGKVGIIDNYVLLAICKSPDEALKAAKGIIK